MTTYIYEKAGKAIRFSNTKERKGNHDILELQGVPFDNDTIEVLNNILMNGSYREQSIVEDFGSINIPQTPFGNNIINVYNKAGDGFQVFIRTVEGSNYKKGDITL